MIEKLNSIDLERNKILSINIPTGTGKTILAYQAAFILSERIDSENFNLNCNISYILSKDLKTTLENDGISKEVYIELSDLAFEKGILVKFETENV